MIASSPPPPQRRPSHRWLVGLFFCAHSGRFCLFPASTMVRNLSIIWFCSWIYRGGAPCKTQKKPKIGEFGLISSLFEKRRIKNMKSPLLHVFSASVTLHDHLRGFRSIRWFPVGFAASLPRSSCNIFINPPLSRIHRICHSFLMSAVCCLIRRQLQIGSAAIKPPQAPSVRSNSKRAQTRNWLHNSFWKILDIWTKYKVYIG
jgi:hypothetical protein